MNTNNMLNPQLHLNPSYLMLMWNKKPIRDGYGDGIVLAGDSDKNVVALCANLMESTRSEAFAKKFPERFFEIGVAEQNMATIAAGLGVSGKIPLHRLLRDLLAGAELRANPRDHRL